MTQPQNSMNQRISHCEKILHTLNSQASLSSKLSFLEKHPSIQNFFASYAKWQQPIHKLPDQSRFIILCILAIEQGENVFKNQNVSQNFLEQLVDTLSPIDDFYHFLGGIVGYYLIVLKLMQESKNPTTSQSSTRFLHPPGTNLTIQTTELLSLIRYGIEHLSEICEILPIAGAGDRLSLCDNVTQEPLPAAQLHFLGFSLLEGIIRDLQAREYLHYKLCGNQLRTPIAMMVSKEKNNDRHILAICEKNHWFGRDKNSIRFFMQPLAPVIDEEGDWVIQENGLPFLKPGGHGVIWKLAIEEGIFDWFYSLKREYALIRQINNPVAGVDSGLLALVGLGLKNKKAFGFASCPRLLNTAEGMNVLLERRVDHGFEYTITNVEYTDFEKKGIQDVPDADGSRFSIFPANTNILFGHLKAIQEVSQKNIVPGLLLNMKTVMPIKGKELHVGRLESTMQNIADFFVDKRSMPLTKTEWKELKTFITFNTRCKTISVTKKLYKPGGPIQETPLGVLYDMTLNMHELFTFYCHFKLPEIPDEKKFAKDGPSFMIILHPALGPLFDVIKQKIRGGILYKGAELQLEIAEVYIENLSVTGSCLIQATHPMGTSLHYGEESGKCVLQNVVIRNKGINYDIPQECWNYPPKRHECFKVILHGNGELVAKDLILEGNIQIEVPDGHRMTLFQTANGKFQSKLEKINHPSWFWKYSFDSTHHIILHDIHQ